MQNRKKEKKCSETENPMFEPQKQDVGLDWLELKFKKHQIIQESQLQQSTINTQ